MRKISGCLFFSQFCITCIVQERWNGAFISNISFYLNEILIVTLKCHYRNSIAIVSPLSQYSRNSQNGCNSQPYTLIVLYITFIRFQFSSYTCFTRSTCSLQFANQFLKVILRSESKVKNCVDCPTVQKALYDRTLIDEITVRMGPVTSDWKTVLKGCPQGWTFGPVMWNTFQNDLPMQVMEAGISMYAEIIKSTWLMTRVREWKTNF